MHTWERLGYVVAGDEYDQIWNRFYREFEFQPRVQASPVIVEPVPSITYRIIAGYGQDEAALVLQADLHAKAYEAFRECTEPGQWLYVLDWQHDAFKFYPHVPFDAADPDAWPIPILPDGDYYIFLAADFRFGTFGHPWEETICVFGQELLDAFAQHPPQLFREIVRTNGNRVTPNAGFE